MKIEEHQSTPAAPGFLSVVAPLQQRNARVRAYLDRLPSSPEVGRMLRRGPDGRVIGDWYGCELSSVFQPIVDPVSGNVIGHEAFLRCLGEGNLDLSPWRLFADNADDEQLIALDRLARTLHTLNYFAVGEHEPSDLLFLNVHGRLLAAVAGDHGRSFRGVVDALGIDPARIVIETPQAAAEQVDLLSFVHRNYRQNGFQVAANVEHPEQWRALASTVPVQFIKIDGEKVLAEPDAAEQLAALSELRGGATVVITRVGLPPQFALKPATLLQGYAYGAPQPRQA